MAVQVCRVTETNPVDWSASVVSSHHRSSGRTSFIRVSASLTSPVPTPRLRHFSSTDRRCSRSATHSWKRTNQPPRCRLQVRRCGWTTIIPPARPAGPPPALAACLHCRSLIVTGTGPHRPANRFKGAGTAHCVAARALALSREAHRRYPGGSSVMNASINSLTRAGFSR